MNTTGTRGALVGFAMVLATLLVISALAYLNVRRLYTHDRLVEHTHEVLAELKTLLTTVLESESGMRGFVITRDPEHLPPFESSIARVKDSLSRLQRLTADNSEQQKSLEEAARLANRRLELANASVAAAKEEGFEIARAQVQRSEGKVTMDALREVLLRMEGVEQRLLVDRMHEAAIAYWTALVTVLLSAVAGVALASVGYALVRRNLAAREWEAQLLLEEKANLEERVQQRTESIRAVNDALREEISERERAECQARQFADELQRSNRELEQFASVASHDLQEPLRKIQAFGDRLQIQCSAELEGKGRDYLERMLASAARMRKLIDDLLEYSRVSTRRQPPVTVDLGQIAQEVVGDFEGRLHQSHGHVEIEGLPTISADPLQMRQLLQNLIGNALKFQRPEVPPMVQVKGRIVSSAATALAGPADATQLGLRCELAVEDNGIGFDPAYAERIFDLFQRLHGRGEYEGTGMGLAICKKIVERHGGAITATSTPGAGSRFTVTLPLLPAENGDAR